MDEFTRVAVLNNEIEASLIDAMLTEGDIPHIIHSYHDAALDGLFQAQKGWGCIEAPTSRKEEIMALLDQIREEAGDGGSN